MNLTERQRLQLFDKIVSLVETKYYDRTFGGQNWSQRTHEYRDRILRAKDAYAFEYEVGHLLSVLGNGHLGLLSPRTKITPRSSINASLRRVQTSYVGERWVFQDVLPGGVAEAAEVRSGDILFGINGREFDAATSPAFPMNAKTSITIDRDAIRLERQFDLTTKRPKYQDNPYSEPNSAVASIVGDVGVLKVGLFPGKIGIDFANSTVQTLLILTRAVVCGE